MQAILSRIKITAHFISLKFQTAAFSISYNLKTKIQSNIPSYMY